MKLRNIILAIAVAAVAGVNVYNNIKDNFTQLSDLQMENVEMLAEAESAGGGQGTLYGNASGTSFCCRSGNNSCSASPC